MVSIRQQDLCLVEEMLLEIRDFAAYSHGTEGGFSTNVGVGTGDYGFDFWEEISRHLNGSNIPKGYKRQSDNVLVGMIQVAAKVSSGARSNSTEPHFFKELVTRVSTSWFSSNSNIVPKYPRRLSAKRGEARSFRHSI